MMTEFRIFTRPRLGQHLRLGLDRLAPLLAAGVARRALAAGADAPASERAVELPAAAPLGASAARVMSAEQAALSALRAPGEGRAVPRADVPKIPAPNGPHLRLVETPAPPAPPKRRGAGVIPPPLAPAAPPQGSAPQAAPGQTRRAAAGGQDARHEAAPEGSTAAGAQAEAHPHDADAPETGAQAEAQGGALETMLRAAAARQHMLQAQHSLASGITARARHNSTSGTGAARQHATAPQPHAPAAWSAPTHRMSARAGFERAPALAALDRVFPRAAQAAGMAGMAGGPGGPGGPGLPEPASPNAGQDTQTDLRRAVIALLEDDLLRHGISPLGEA